MLWNLVLCSHTRTQCRIQIRSATVQGTQLWLPLSNSHFSRVSSSLVCAALLTPHPHPLPPAPIAPFYEVKNHWERTREPTKTTTTSDQSVKSNFTLVYWLLLPTLPNSYSIPVLHLAMSTAYLRKLPTKGLVPRPKVGPTDGMGLLSLCKRTVKAAAAPCCGLKECFWPNLYTA